MDGKTLAVTEIDGHLCPDSVSIVTDWRAKGWRARTGGELWVHGDIESGILQFVDAGTDTRVGVAEFEQAGGDYPNWRRVMPGDFSDRVAFPHDIASDLFARFQRSFAVYGKNPPLRLRTALDSDGEPGDMIEITSTVAPGLRGVLMGMRR